MVNGATQMIFPDYAEDVLKARYLLKDKGGKVIETPDQMFRRVAKSIAKDCKDLEERFYTIMRDLDFLPNTPCLMNAGTPGNQLAACFVLPVNDSLESIFATLRQAALIFSAGGGCGYTFSQIRPKGDLVSSTKGRASGPVSVMTIFDKTTEVIKQGGRQRGANMGILHYTHPDILEFIRAKRDSTMLQNFNVSVALGEKFFEALHKNKTYKLINPKDGKMVHSISARTVFNELVKSNWLCGDPGVIFIDEINWKHPLKDWVESTSPCGEIPLLAYESCILGSVNLSQVVRDGMIDYQKLENLVRLGVEFLDNAIDVSRYPCQEIEQKTKETRKIGLGVMGFADMLIKLKIRYDAPEAVEIARTLMRFIAGIARKRSEELGAEKGDFVRFKDSAWAKQHKHMRNCTVTAIAPTGSISLIADTSSGIEPIFAAKQARVIMGKTYHTTHKLYAGDTKKYLVAAHEVSAAQHVRIQAAFQESTDNAVSKTINLPSTATEKDMAKVYMLAHELGCKGITIYRDQSKGKQILREM